MGNPPQGFTYEVRKNETVAIYHHGRLAKTLQGNKASRFLEDMDKAAGFDDWGDRQQRTMAVITGNYKRGNERNAQPGGAEGSVGDLSL